MNFSKTYFLLFSTKQHKVTNIQIKGPDSIILNTNSTKFLGLLLDSTISWKAHITELVSKLTKACYAIGAVKPVMSREALRNIYFSYFHSFTSDGDIFWGKSHEAHEVFEIEKRATSILTTISKRDSYRLLFKELKILSQPSQYIYIFIISICSRK